MNLAFIGLGTMGAPMAKRLIQAGHLVTVHNRTRQREVPLAEAGASTAASPKEAAAGADVVITMVSDTPDVREVVLGDGGAAHGMNPGNLLIDMSTISPSATREIAAELRVKGIDMIDAPVSGGSEGAVNGTLSIMVGGTPEAFERARPLLEVMGKTVTRVGATGSGQVTKAINQVIIAGTYAAVAEGMAIALAADIDIKAAHAAVAGGAAGSWVLSNRAGNMIENNYPLGFRTRLHRKDLSIALDAGRELGVPLPISAFVEQLETSLIRRGYGEEDVSNIARVFREMAGIT